MVKTLVIAGTHSSVGKTTIVVGLCAALRARGLVVQPFKVGPDYIDPGHHTRAAGRVCRNLDTWMMPPERMQALFAHASLSADIAIIEGVMGLFDGADYEGDTGSTAEVAKLLGAPVLVVLDASKMARSAGAIAKGMQEFDRGVNVAGFIVNRVGSEGHGRGVAQAITAATGLPVLGWLARDERLHIPERYLGLTPSAEPGQWGEVVQSAAEMVAKYLNLDPILSLACDVSGGPLLALRASETKGRPVIAVARDEAFHFCYQDNLDLLENAGAVLEYFSPIHDAYLPPRTAGILLSGGFPEVHAEQLTANQSMLDAVRRAHAQQLPIYAECGGLMYLTESVTDHHGRCFAMTGLLPGRSVMTRRLTLGYRQATAAASSWLLDGGESVRGHEFHYSLWQDRPAELPPAFLLMPRDGSGTPRPEGACVANLWASYVHLHFWAKPELAQRLVAACVH